MKVSVIIAAYNAEKYLAEAIYSAVNQSMRPDDYEIIAVNDGSQDETADILQAYQSKYSNIKIINKENGGPSSARNLALKEAKGEYVYFLDADDIMDRDSLLSLYNRAAEQSADIVIARYDIFSKAGKSYVTNIDEMVKLDTIPKYDTRILWTFALWNKLFRKSLIDENNITFPDVSYSEDGVFVMRCVFGAGKITGLDKIILHYRKLYSGVADSITASVSKGKIEDYIQAHDMIYQIIIESIMKDYPQFSNLEDIKKDYDMNLYINDFLRKVVQVLINQFYSKLLPLDDECVKMIADNIKSKCSEMDYSTLMFLQSKHPEVPLFSLSSSKEEILRHKYITAVLYGEGDTAFIDSLRSLTNQNLIGVKIVVPCDMKKTISGNKLLFDNMEFIDAKSERELNTLALKNADTDLIIFCSHKFIYSTNALKTANRRFMRNDFDFVTTAVYTESCLMPMPIEASLNAINNTSYGQIDEYNDNLLSNKVFRVAFLRDLGADINSDGFVKLCYQRGCYSVLKSKFVSYMGSQDEFISHKSGDATKNGFSLPAPNLKKQENNNQIEFNTNCEYYKKFASLVENEKLKNQVCIVYTGDKLQNSADAIKRHINARLKTFEVNNDDDFDKKTAKAIACSKLVITDRALPHLECFPVKEHQHFILLVKAEDLFKTQTLNCDSIPAIQQYSLICVSSKDTIPVYSEKLSVSSDKFCASGSPKTDILFGFDKKRNQIIKGNKSLKGKEIILLDTGERLIGNAKIDYGKLSNSIGENQVIITANPLSKEYKNIIQLKKHSKRELMIASDMLITDYSSIIFEYSLLGKPIVFFCPDMNVNNVGYCLHYPEDLPSYLIRSQDELESFIKDKSAHKVSENQDAFAKKYMAQCDGNAGVRLAKIINDYMEAE